MKTNCRKRPLTFGGIITAAHEAWFSVRIIAKLRAAIASQAPVGYEDETGFHYGVKAQESKS
jgi:hypothetical protein